MFILLFMASCAREPKVGDWYQFTENGARVQITNLGPLDRMKALVDSFHTAKLHYDSLKAHAALAREPAGSEIWKLRSSHLRFIREQYLLKMRLTRQRYNSFRIQKGELCFMFMDGDDPVFLPVSDLSEDFVRVSP
jgi:hypothetical protein